MINIKYVLAFVLGILLFLGCQTIIKQEIQGHIYCYDPHSQVPIYDGPFSGSVALDDKGRGSIMFRESENELMQIIIGANCIIRYDPKL